MKKRLFSLFLSAMLCLTLLPTAALATAPEITNQPAAQSEETPCSHEELEYLPTADGEHHQERCKTCSEVLDTVECDFESGEGYGKTDENSHYGQCICGNVSKTGKPHEYLWVPIAGNMHIFGCVYCGYHAADATAKEHTYNDDGVCEICGFQPVAADNAGERYGSLEDALNAVANGGYVKLETFSKKGKEITSEQIDFDRPGVSAELKMNGYTLTSYYLPLAVHAGELTVTGDAVITATDQPTGQVSPAVSVTGGKLIFTDKLTAQGGAASRDLREPAVKAAGGELEFRDTVNLKGGLTLTGDAVLTGGLKAGSRFWVEGIETQSRTIDLTGSSRYQEFHQLLADGCAFQYESDGKVFDAAEAIDTNAVIVEHSEHTFRDRGDTYSYWSCDCGVKCYHQGTGAGWKDGRCMVCGYPCKHPHVNAKGRCLTCLVQMAAKVDTTVDGTITTTYVTDLTAALNSAGDGTKITLLKDAVLSQNVDICGEKGSTAVSTITLELAGHSITGSHNIAVGRRYVGYPEPDIEAPTKLIVTGTGSIQTQYSLMIASQGELDLNGWTGGTISILSVERNKSTSKEGTLTVGEKAGHIGKLHYYSWPSDTITNSKLYGGTYGEIEGVNNTDVHAVLSLTGLLPSGYAFQNSDGAFVPLETLAQGDTLTNVSVVPCTHAASSDLFTGSSCPYCGADDLAAVVTTADGAAAAYTSLNAAITAVLSDTSGTYRGCTVKLLSNAGDLALTDVHTDFFLDLNGKTMTGLSFTGGTAPHLMDSSDGAGKIKSLMSSSMILGALPRGGFSLKSGGAWADSETLLKPGTLSDVSVSAAKVVHVDISDDVSISYGEAMNIGLALSGDARSFQWYERKDGTWAAIDGAVKGSYTTPASLTQGNHSYRCAITGSDGSVVLTDVCTVTVTQADLSAEDSVVFTQVKDAYGRLGNTAANDGRLVVYPFGGHAEYLSPVTYFFEVTCRGSKLTEGVDYEIVNSSNEGTNAGTYTLTIQGKGNYTGTAEHKWTIEPYRLGELCGVNICKDYDGTAALERAHFQAVDMALFINDSSALNPDIGSSAPTITLNEETDLILSNLSFDAADAGTRAASFTVTLTNQNFVFADGSREMKIQMSRELNPFGSNYTEIRKAPAPELTQTGTLTVYNRSVQTYEVDLTKLLPALTAPCTYGDIRYGDVTAELAPGYYDKETGASVTEDGILKLPVLNVDSAETGEIGTVTVLIEPQNYESFPLTITISAANRSSSVTPGSTTVKSETTTNPDGSTTKTETKPDGTVIETTTSADGSITRNETKPDGSSVTEITDVSGSTGTVRTDENGQTKAKANLSEEAIEDAKQSGEAVKVPAPVTAGKTSDSAPTVDIKLPGGAGKTEIEIPVDNVTSGTVAIIVHPDGTEEIVKDSVPTKDGIRLTVDGDTTVKIVDNSRDFRDTRDHWSRDDVNFVAARDLFIGVSNDLFGVGDPMTRGMVNTVLARLAGVDTTPDAGQNWYEIGSTWAKENGITDGTNLTGAVTREQLAAMLYRFSGSPKVSGSLSFTDAQEASGYAQDALLWASQNGILNGVGGGHLAPTAEAERAQVAAMLARYLKNR